MRAKPPPAFDILLVRDDQDERDNYLPVDRVFDIADLLKLEGVRFRYAYVTSQALEYGSAGLFEHLYFNARITGGKVLHVSDYRSDV